MRIMLICCVCIFVSFGSMNRAYAQGGAPHNQGLEDSQNWFQGFVDRVLSFLKEFVQNAGVNLSKIFEKIKEILARLFKFIRLILGGGWEFMGDLFNYVSNAVNRLFSWQKSIMERAFEKMKVEYIIFHPFYLILLP